MSARYGEYAAVLHELADRCAALADRTDLPEPQWFSIDLHPGGRSGPDDDRDPAVVAAAVDTVATALIGKAGTLRRLSGGSYHHDASAHVGPVWVKIYDSVRPPTQADPASRLRAAEATWRWGAAA